MLRARLRSLGFHTQCMRLAKWCVVVIVVVDVALYCGVVWCALFLFSSLQYTLLCYFVWHSKSPSPSKICWIRFDSFSSHSRLTTAPAAWNDVIFVFVWIRAHTKQHFEIVCIIHRHLCMCGSASPWKPCPYVAVGRRTLVLVCILEKLNGGREPTIVFDRNFSLEKGFFIAIARQLSPAERHIH